MSDMLQLVVKIMDTQVMILAVTSHLEPCQSRRQAESMSDIRDLLILIQTQAGESLEMMKTVVRVNENYAGVYGTVVRAGELRVGQVVTLGG